MDKLDRQSDAYKQKYIEYCRVEGQIKDSIKRLRANGELSKYQLGERMRDLWVVKGFIYYGLNT